MLESLGGHGLLATPMARAVSSPRGDFWGLSPPKQSSKSPQIET